MNNYAFTFIGRATNAIGAFHACKVTTQGIAEEKAKLALYDTHEHVQHLQCVEVVSPVNPATRINRDANGNPRYVVHFLAFITEQDRTEINAEAERLRSLGQWATSVELLYVRALQRARRIGGRKFHNKQYGGGIVFQCYGQQEIDKLVEQGKAIDLSKK